MEVNTHFLASHFASTHFDTTHFIPDVDIEEVVRKVRPYLGEKINKKLWAQIVREDEEMIMIIHAFMETLD